MFGDFPDGECGSRTVLSNPEGHLPKLPGDEAVSAVWDNWDINEIQEQVKNAYFVIQECWKRQDPDYAKDYMSQKCYDDFVMKLGWMQVRMKFRCRKMNGF